ncbi:glycoside hydrolase family 53 protein [Cohnella laeviribosi]|uniref:glycoside hydrolase family 53 protein n=1 Tax=Cohnella laeviribosi TaxID=380174 RepID=UPI003D1DA14E
MENRLLIGMDISFADEIEAAGGAYYERGERRDIMAILQDAGTDSIRLRIWNDPPGGFCNLERTLVMARRIKARGLHFLLDFHYSDGWADPGKQWKPKAWAGLDLDGLGREVFRYTSEVLSALAKQGTPPDMVQVGNEITNGLLWDEGRVDGEFDTDGQREALASLLKAGVLAVRETAPQAEVMLHIDRGGDWPGTFKFFDRMRRSGVDFDVIGQSFYPWWHGTLDDLRGNLEQTAREFGKPIYVAETAYPWTLRAPEGDGLIVGREDQLHPGYPASVEGQSAYLRDLMAVIRGVPNGLGRGLYWWEPAWIPAKTSWSVGHANNWSNLTLFDFAGRKLASWDALRS